MLKTIYSFQGAALACFGFIVLNFFIDGGGYNNEVNLVLTISSFLFAILAGFFISRLNTRYDKIIESIGTEDAHWLGFYKTATLVSKKFTKKIS